MMDEDEDIIHVSMEVGKFHMVMACLITLDLDTMVEHLEATHGLMGRDQVDKISDARALINLMRRAQKLAGEMREDCDGDS